jgi:hypothetical protein
MVCHVTPVLAVLTAMRPFVAVQKVDPSTQSPPLISRLSFGNRNNRLINSHSMRGST